MAIACSSDRSAFRSIWPEKYTYVSVLITFISVHINMIYMPLVKSIKNIGTSGTSKVIPVTQEIKALGLDVRDSVVAALAVPGSEEDYALNLASAFINPDVFYVNNRIMCCKDRYPNGQCIENRLNSRSLDECEQAYRRMAAMQDLIDVMREYTKNKVSGPYSYYNDELHSFIAKFDPDDIVDKDEVGVKIKTLIARMNALKACLETDLFDIAPLDSIRVLRKNFDRALCDADALLRCPPDKREEYCEQLNDVWNEEVNNVIYCDLYFIGLIIPFHMEDYPVYDCFPEFMVIPAPTQRMAKEKLQKTASETVDRGMDFYTNAFGPYENESECKDIVSYLKIKWMIDVGAPADHNTVALVKNMVNEYNIITGE